MAAIVRVKRRLDQDPVDSLLLSCKRFKSTEISDKENATTEVKSVFKFAGTLPSKNVDVETPVLEAIRREKLQKEYKRHLVDIPTRTRKTHTHNSAKNRFKVVSSFRSHDVTDDKKSVISKEENDGPVQSEGRSSQSDREVLQKGGDDDKSYDSASDSCLEGTDQSASASSIFCLFDIEGELTCEESDSKPSPDPVETITCNGQPMIRKAVEPSPQSANDGDGYVYDIYYMNSPKFDFRNLENILAIEALREDLVIEEQGRRDSEDEYGEDEDSNDENNWRNDYPDEDEDLFGDTISFDDDGDKESGNASDESYSQDFGVSQMIGRRLKICDDDDDDDVGDEWYKGHVNSESDDDS